ncbi:MAG: PAS domain-containing sensor histidine kinase [Elusimicrobia bacterium]|nr:PAS domain-containing sensor histidine kinase [Elusimicrobiota bacterium]
MASVETLLDPLFQGLGDGICVTGADGAILYMNAAACALLGVPGGRWPALSLCELLCGNLEGAGGRDFAAACPLRKSPCAVPGVTFAGRYGHHVSYDWTGFRIRKQEKWVYLKLRCMRMPTDLFGPDGEKRFIVIQDATAETELQQNKEDWRNMVAHDLRSPLTNIYGTLRVLEDLPEGRPLGESDKKLIEIGSRGCRRMLELVELYLDIAKLDAALMPVSLQPVGLHDAVRECVEQQQPLARERRIEIDIDVPRHLEALADKELLARVLDNLLNNALKFSPEGGTIEVAARLETGGRAALSVKDHGPGIAADDIPLMFDRFHQARARRAGRTQGTGLGLTFCKEAVRVMHGEIGVSSAPGIGSEFTIRLGTPVAAP